MFKFLKKAKADAAAIREEVYEHICFLVTRVATELAFAHDITGDCPERNDLMARALQIRSAFELVRLGAHPSEFQTAEPLARVAAKVAHDAINEALLTGRNDNEKLIGKIRRLLGYSSDGSRRED